MATGAPPALKTLSLEEAKSALAEAMGLFSEEANQAKLRAVAEAAGGNVGQLLMTLPAAASEVIAGILAKYRFPAGPGGAWMG